MTKEQLLSMVEGFLDDGLEVKVTLANAYYTTTLNYCDPVLDDPSDIMKGLSYALQNDTYRFCQLEVLENGREFRNIKEELQQVKPADAIL